MSVAPEGGPDLVTRTHQFLTELDAESGVDNEAERVHDTGEYAADDDDDESGDDEFTDRHDSGGGDNCASAATIDAVDQSYAADAADDGYSSPVDTADFLDPPADQQPTPPDQDDEKPSTPARFSKPILIGFIALTAVVAIGLSAAMIAMRSSPTVVSDQAADTAPQVVVAGPAPSSPPPVPNTGVDAPIPFTASADCPLGSSAAQAVAGTDPTRAWVCVRGGADGQVLTLDLGQPMMVTAICIVPGWVGTDTSGADQWLQHRVATRVQWTLINGDQRIPVPQNTNNVHGEACQPMPGNGPDRGVLASQVQMIVQQTSRAPADTPQPSSGPGAPGPGGGLLNDVLGGPMDAPTASNPQAALGGPASDSANADPADNTFAVSSIKIIGHLPL